MLNVRTTVVDAFKMIGAINDAESLDGTRTTIGTELLNELISQLNLDNFFASSITTATLIPVVSSGEYTIGIDPDPLATPADIASPRPATIMRGYYSYQQNSVKTEMYQVAPQDIGRFQQAQQTSGVPVYFTYISDYPYGIIRLSCKLMANAQLTLTYNKALPVVGINDNLPVPPEYQPALKHSLAYVLANRYGAPQEVIAGMKNLREESHAMIKRNTLARTPLIHELGGPNGWNQAPNVYNFGAY